MAYDVKFREQVMKYLGKGHTFKEASDLFEVGITTIVRWKKLQQETGKLENRPLNRKHKKIDPVQLKAYIAENPDSYMSEIAEVFNCTDVAVYYALKRLKLTHKKSLSYVERNEDLRTEFIETIGSYPQYKLYYVDECGIDKYLYREYAYAPKGVPVFDKVSGKKIKRINNVVFCFYLHIRQTLTLLKIFGPG